MGLYIPHRNYIGQHDVYTILKPHDHIFNTKVPYDILISSKGLAYLNKMV